METETYLNLGSEQFNSWVNEFENKYNKIEKSNVSTINSISSSEKIELSNNNDSDSDIENSSISEEDPETSNVFISQDNKGIELEDETVSNSSATVSSSRRLIFNRHRYRRNLGSSSESIKNINELRKEVINDKYEKTEKESISEKVSNKLPNRNFINSKLITPPNEKLMTLKELNSILPNYIQDNTKVNNLENNDKKNVIEEKKINSSRLGEKALYRYIAMRRR